MKGSVRFVANGPGVVMQCAKSGMTMIYVEQTSLFELNGIEFRNCTSPTTNGPIGGTNITTVKFLNSYIHNMTAFDNGGFSFIQNLDSMTIDNCTFSNLAGTFHLKLHSKKLSGIWRSSFSHKYQES